MLVIIVGVALIVAFNRLYISMRTKEQHRQFNVYKIKRSSISFQPTKAKDVVVDRTTIGKLVEGEIDKLYVCTVNVWNVGKDRLRLRFCTKNQNDKCVLDTEPKQIILQPKKACAFRVLITRTCTCVVDKPLALTAWHGAPHASDTPARAQALDGHHDEAAQHRVLHGALTIRGELWGCLPWEIPRERRRRQASE